jgi:hypothetical protein
MMAEDVEFRIDVTFCSIRYELAVLEHYMIAVEQQIPSIKQAAYEEMTARPQLLGGEVDDADLWLASDEVQHFSESVAPRLLRGSVLVALWAVYESAISEIANHLMRQLGITVSLADLLADMPGCNEFNKMLYCYKRKLRMPLVIDPVTQREINVLNLMRNALAHANGRLSAIKVDDQTRIQRIIRKDLGVSVAAPGTLLFSADYVCSAFHLVSGSLNELMKRVHPKFE